jgi:hypothetical protein
MRHCGIDLPLGGQAAVIAAGREMQYKQCLAEV